MPRALGNVFLLILMLSLGIGSRSMHDSPTRAAPGLTYRMIPHTMAGPIHPCAPLTVARLQANPRWSEPATTSRPAREYHAVGPIDRIFAHGREYFDVWLVRHQEYQTADNAANRPVKISTVRFYDPQGRPLFAHRYLLRNGESHELSMRPCPPANPLNP